MSVFYDQLVGLHSVRPHLEQYLSSEDEIQEVLEHLDQTLHHVVFEVIFAELPPHVHEPFLIRFQQNPSDPQHLVFLRQYIPHIEQAIQEASETSKQKFIDAIHE